MSTRREIASDAPPTTSRLCVPDFEDEEEDDDEDECAARDLTPGS